MSQDHPADEYEFDRDTRVDKSADGGFTATLTDGWTTFTSHPNGGYVLGAALNALGRNFLQKSARDAHLRELAQLPDKLLQTGSLPSHRRQRGHLFEVPVPRRHHRSGHIEVTVIQQARRN